MADYTRNAIALSTIEWAPFNLTTGAVSNIDNVIAAVGSDHLRYISGTLYWAGNLVASGENVCLDENDVPLKLTDAELAADWTGA